MVNFTFLVLACFSGRHVGADHTFCSNIQRVLNCPFFRNHSTFEFNVIGVLSNQIIENDTSDLISSIAKDRWSSTVKL